MVALARTCCFSRELKAQSTCTPGRRKTDGLTCCHRRRRQNDGTLRGPEFSFHAVLQFTASFFLWGEARVGFWSLEYSTTALNCWRQYLIYWKYRLEGDLSATCDKHNRIWQEPRADKIPCTRKYATLLTLPARLPIIWPHKVPVESYPGPICCRDVGWAGSERSWYSETHGGSQFYIFPGLLLGHADTLYRATCAMDNQTGTTGPPFFVRYSRKEGCVALALQGETTEIARLASQCLELLGSQSVTAVKTILS